MTPTQLGPGPPRSQALTLSHLSPSQDAPSSTSDPQAGLEGLPQVCGERGVARMRDAARAAGKRNGRLSPHRSRISARAAGGRRTRATHSPSPCHLHPTEHEGPAPAGRAQPGRQGDGEKREEVGGHDRPKKSWRAPSGALSLWDAMAGGRRHHSALVRIPGFSQGHAACTAGGRGGLRCLRRPDGAPDRGETLTHARPALLSLFPTHVPRLSLHLKTYEGRIVEGDPASASHVVRSSPPAGASPGGPEYNFATQRVVGNGSFGVVYQATCLETGETVRK